MQDQIHHRQEMLNALRDPDSWNDPAFKADIYRQMALEQKYVERIESLTDNLRKQSGLDPIQRNPVGGGPDSPYESPYAVTEYPDGTVVLTKRAVMDAEGNTIITTRDGAGGLLLIGHLLAGPRSLRG